MNHDNSTKSYEEQKAKGSVECWRRKVYDVFWHGFHTSYTDREVMNILGALDPNFVRPEITRLTSDGILKEIGKTQCRYTKKTVRHSSWTGKEYYSNGNKLGGSHA